MKNLTKTLGIAGITALSFLPMNGKGQNNLNEKYMPVNFSKLDTNKFCWEMLWDEAVLVRNMKILFSEYQKNKNMPKEKIDSLNGVLNLYRTKYNYIKRKANELCTSKYYKDIYKSDFSQDTLPIFLNSYRFK